MSHAKSPSGIGGLLLLCLCFILKVMTENEEVAQPLSQAHQRGIMTFVHRRSRLPLKLQKSWDMYAPFYLLSLPRPPHMAFGVDTSYILTRNKKNQIWGNDNPLIIEIGSGQGENIAAAAAAHPHINYLALEVFDQGIAHTLSRCGKGDLSNLRIAQVNAVDFFALSLEEGLCAEVWTYFPDPWPKKKHHKRRLVQPAFSTNVWKSLQKGGIWRISTDIDDYALHIHETLDNSPLWKNMGTKLVSLPTEHIGKGNMEKAILLPHANFCESERYEGRVVTSFEKKGLKKGHVVHDMMYCRKG